MYYSKILALLQKKINDRSKSSSRQSKIQSFSRLIPVAKTHILINLNSVELMYKFQ